MPINEQIGSRIRIARKLAGLTQNDLAKKLGITGAAIAYIESGKRRARVDVLARIAEVTQRPLAFFYEEKNSASLDGHFKQLRQQLSDIQTLLDATEVERTKSQKVEFEKTKLFRELLDHSTDLIFIVDAVSEMILDVNKRACEKLGYSRNELMTMKVRDIQSAIKTDEDWNAFIEQLVKRGSYIVEGSHKKKDGGIFISESSIRHLTIGDRDYCIAVVRSLEGREEARVFLERQIDLYKEFLSGLDLAAVILSSTGRVIDMNERYCQIIGAPSLDSVRGINAFKVPYLIESGFVAAAKKCIYEQTVTEIEYHVTTLFDKPVKMKAKMAPLLAADGKVMAIQIFAEEL